MPVDHSTSQPQGGRIGPSCLTHGSVAGLLIGALLVFGPEMATAQINFYSGEAAVDVGSQEAPQDRSRRRPGAAFNFAGFEPRLGGMPPGAGLAGGVAFRPFPQSSTKLVEARLVGSLRRYWGTQLVLGYDNGSTAVIAFGRYTHMPKERFFGVGSESAIDRESDYRLNELLFGTHFGYRPTSVVRLGAQVSYRINRPGPGRNDDLSDVTTVFPAGMLAGLLEDSEHLVLGGWASYDTRDVKPSYAFGLATSPLGDHLHRYSMYARRGFFVRAHVDYFITQQGEDLDVIRIETESQQYIPVISSHVLALRQDLVLTASDRTPVFLMPALGGAYTLRGFELFRFRDANAFLFSAEYRIPLLYYVDFALFSDVAQTFGEGDPFSARNFRASGGVGVRIQTPFTPALRLDLARSGEGFKVYLRLEMAQ